MNDEYLPWFDPCDMVDVPDELEPDDNRPDAVMDNVRDHLISEDIVPWIFRRWGDENAVLIAHQVLSEYEARHGRSA